MGEGGAHQSTHREQTHHRDPHQWLTMLTMMMAHVAVLDSSSNTVTSAAAAALPEADDTDGDVAAELPEASIALGDDGDADSAAFSVADCP